MTTATFVFLFLSLVVLSSCTTTVVRSEAELFFRKHPEQKERYYRMSPTDARNVEECADGLYTTRRHWAEARKSRGEDPKEVEKMLALAKQWYEAERDVAEKLHDAMKRTGGQAYKYEIQEVPHGEGGFLIIKDGEIVDRLSFTTWTNHEKPERSSLE